MNGRIKIENFDENESLTGLPFRIFIVLRAFTDKIFEKLISPKNMIEFCQFHDCRFLDDEFWSC